MSDAEKKDPKTDAKKVEETPKKVEKKATADAKPKAENATTDSAKEEKKPAAETKAKAEKTEAAKDDKSGGSRNRSGNSRNSPRSPRGGGRRDPKKNILGTDSDKPELAEKVVFINRCAKVVKGGRRFSFSALVVCGDQQGMVGVGFGKANEVAECIRKASETAKNSLEPICLNDATIPHETNAEHCGGRVLLRPASPGTGVIAGGGMRAVCEVAGIKDVLGKSIGSNNHANVVKATIAALRMLRSREEIYSLRGKKIHDKKAL